jgi:MFS transporter, DHA1 family, tetracycline resistance protein
MKFDSVDRRLFTILMIVFVQLVGAAMILPVLPLYAQNEFNIPPQTISLLVSSFFVAQFLAGPTIGRMSDRYGRVPVLIVSQVGTAISFVMLAVAGSVEVLFLSRILDGITGGNIVVAQAYVTDITPREKRTQSLGYIFAAFGLGFVIGPALGGVLSAAFGARIPFLIAAVAAAATVVLTWATLHESLTPERREKNRRFSAVSLAPRQVMANVPLLLILAITFGGQFGLGMLQATFALYGEAVLFAGFSRETTNIGIGLLLAVVGLAQLSTQVFLIRRLLKRYGDAMLVIIGGALRAGGMFAFALIISPWLSPIGAVMFAVGTGLMMPPLQSLATDTVAEELHGGVLGLHQSSMSLSIICGTALAGVVFAVSPTVPYWLAGGLFVVMLLPSVFLLRWSRTRNPASSASQPVAEAARPE